MEINSRSLVRTDLHLLASTDEGFKFHDRLPNVSIETTVNLGAAESKKLIKLISLLTAVEPAEQMRCHEPRYAAECHYENGASVRISFCFKCKNLIVSSTELRGIIGFNPTNPPGRNLMAFLNATSGIVLDTKST